MAQIRKVKGLEIGDTFECKTIDQVKDVEYVVTSFPNRKSVKGRAKLNIGKTISVSIKSIESEFLKV